MLSNTRGCHIYSPSPFRRIIQRALWRVGLRFRGVEDEMTRLGLVLGFLLLAMPAHAACVCKCENSRMHTICTDQIDIAQCSGFCTGSTCLGFCKPNGAIAEQSRLQWERKNYILMLRPRLQNRNIILEAH
jgi:hypothetical protein